MISIDGDLEKKIASNRRQSLQVAIVPERTSSWSLQPSLYSDLPCDKRQDPGSTCPF